MKIAIMQSQKLSLILFPGNQVPRHGPKDCGHRAPTSHGSFPHQYFQINYPPKFRNTIYNGKDKSVQESSAFLYGNPLVCLPFYVIESFLRVGQELL